MNNGSAEQGTVYLVGAGPGDPRLMTHRATELVATADVIFHDRLIPVGVLGDARADAELEYVGKNPGGNSTSQHAINELLIAAAQQNKSVVRLKGGDPFVFGRGGEEAEALSEAGIPFEVVPGITAGIAAAAYAGIPVTHRDECSGVAFVTGHEDPNKPETALNWQALADFPGTLVFYMGVSNLARIAAQLMEHGQPADQPIAVVERGTTTRQHTVTGTLSDIAKIASEAGIAPPAITIVGPVVKHREDLAWLERRPLTGKTVAVTRARAQSSTLAARLADLGAGVVEAPSIRVEPRPVDGAVRDMIEHIEDFDFVCVTSANGARYLWEALVECGKDARALAGATVAVIGPATGRALREHGIIADFTPSQAVAEALIEALAPIELDNKKVLIATASGARKVLYEGLTARGANVDVVALYDTVIEPLPEERIEALQRADYITFTSGSSANHLVKSVGGPDKLPSGARLISIGPITSEAIAKHGLKVDVEAADHNVEGLVAALLEDAGR